MKNFIFVAFLFIMLSSCQKEGRSPVVDEWPSFATNDSLLPTGGPKILSSTILTATNANQIPSQMFQVNPIYKSAYVHLLQYSGECSWTNYVLCTGAIARANGNVYPATHAKVTAVKNDCIGHAGTTLAASNISTLNWYAGAYDYGIIDKQLCATAQTTAGRFDMVKYMLAHINTYHSPFIALALDPNTGVGHYLIVWSIDWQVGGTGSMIYYTNTLLPVQTTFDMNLKSCSLTTFLNWMQNNTQANYYNCLFLWPH